MPPAPNRNALSKNAHRRAAALTAAMLAITPAAFRSAPASGAELVLDRYVRALGGAAAVEAVRTRVSAYEMSLGWRINGTLEVRQARPDRIVERGRASGWGWHGEFRKGFNGTDGWIQAPDERLHALDGRALQVYALESRLDRVAHLTELYPTQVLQPDRAIGGRLCHVIELTTAFGARELWYLDPATDLLVQTEVHLDGSPDLKATSTTTFDDYRLVDDVRVPFRLTVQEGGHKYSLIAKSIRNNVPLSPNDFDVPR